MNTVSRILPFAVVLVAAAALGNGQPVSEIGPPASVVMFDGTGRTLPARIALQRGSPRTLTAKAFDQDGNEVSAPFTWAADPGGVVLIVPLGDAHAGVTFTVIKDAFDDPNGFEPWANVRACVGSICAWTFVAAAVDISGDWDADVIVTNSAIGDQHLTLKFEQNGRQVTCTDASSASMFMSVVAKDLRLTDPSGRLPFFVGTLTSRGFANGRWRSSKDYEGVWHARKK
jgi:hypothetical protein